MNKRVTKKNVTINNYRICTTYENPKSNWCWHCLARFRGQSRFVEASFEEYKTPRYLHVMCAFEYGMKE